MLCCPHVLAGSRGYSLQSLVTAQSTMPLRLEWRVAGANAPRLRV